MDKRELIHLQKVQKVLALVAQKLNSLDIKWLLGASGSLMVHGVDIIPWDLDIFTSTENVKKLAFEFSNYIINPLHYYIEGNKKYLEFQMKIDGVEVEICELDIVKTSPIFIKFKNQKIPVNFLEEELKFYKSRKGKDETVKLIEKKLYG